MFPITTERNLLQCPDSEVRHALPLARSELRNQRDTSKPMILVPLLNPKFAIELAAIGVRASGSGHLVSASFVSQALRLEVVFCDANDP
jgi:hypothetical protein